MPQPFDQKFILKGFLYQKGDQWILADQPDLKTCCLNEEHWILSGDFSNHRINAPIQVSGIPRSTECGASILTNVEVLEKRNTAPYWTIGAVSMIMLFFMMRKIRRLLLP